MKKELSIFIDESGDFGPTENHSPYYIITMVFHEQNDDISKNILELNSRLNNLNLKSNYIHAGPIIRKEREYYSLPIDIRRRMLTYTLQFVRKSKIKYRHFFIEKRQVSNSIELVGRLSEQISNFVRENLDYFLSFDSVKIYYDNGQMEVTKILSSVFNSFISNIDFRLVKPSEYKLFQVADFCCTLELINLKIINKSWSKSEEKFFKSKKLFTKNYLKTIRTKLFK